MIHYHGGPVTPLAALYELAGRHFCVSFAYRQQVRRISEIAQSVMLDNGAFSAFTRGRPIHDWTPFYVWADEWLDAPTTWAVIPDKIGGGAQIQDALIREWPHGEKGAPVWHMEEPLERMLRLVDEWPRVCFGSTGEYWRVGSPNWAARMDTAWNVLARSHARTPTIHMLRGMALSSGPWPFASVDSTDIARNHHRTQNTARAMADHWDALQPPARWTRRPAQYLLFEDDYTTA